jgi:fluoroquinolone transport system permease protein
VLNRPRVTTALIVPLARSLRWWPLLAGGLTGLGLAWLGTRPTIPPLDPAAAVVWLRLGIVTLAVGAAFVLDDQSEPTTLSTPVSLLRRRALRLALAAPAVAAWWGGLTLVAARLPADTTVPLGPLAVEAAALLVTVIALAAAAAPHLADRCGGVAATSTILALVVGVSLLPERVALFADPGSGQWTPAHERWWVVTAAAAVAFVLASRDPGRWRTPATAD